MRDPASSAALLTGWILRLLSSAVNLIEEVSLLGDAELEVSAAFLTLPFLDNM